MTTPTKWLSIMALAVALMVIVVLVLRCVSTAPIGYAQYWKAMSVSRISREYRFRVVDETRHGVGGVGLAGMLSVRNPDGAGRDDAVTRVNRIWTTDAEGVARTGLVSFQWLDVVMDAESLASKKLLATNGDSGIENCFHVTVDDPTGPQLLPVDRRPAGFDYEFRVVRSRGPQVLWVWQTDVQMPADGTPVRMRPFSIGLPSTVAINAVVPREELTVALWRDSSVPMTEMQAPYQDMPESKIPFNLDAAWSCTVSCPYGGIQVRRPWSPSESAPVDGYVRELRWSGDAKTPAFQGPWGDQPLQLWWQRLGTPVRYLQVDLRFTWEVPDRTNAPFSAATFSVVQLYRLNVGGGQVFEYRHRADVSIDLEEMPWYRRYDSVEALQAIGRESVASASSATPAAAAASSARP